MCRIKWLLSSLFIVLFALSLTGCGAGQTTSIWSTITDGDEVLTYQVDGIPSTAFRQPRLLASGDATDPTLLTAIQQATGRTETQVAELLASYDCSHSTVDLLKLRGPAYVVRYWSEPTAKLGRWYAPLPRTGLYAPAEARRVLALPWANTGRYASLYKLNARVLVIRGRCADMTANPEAFGPYATGGGEQYFVPDATRWVVDHVELNPHTIELVAELRFAQLTHEAGRPLTNEVEAP